jgi:hypothetical protein
MIRFKLHITHYFWDCGDGCCSDSGYKIKVVDSTTETVIYENDDWENNRDKHELRKEGLSYVEKIIGREPFHNQDYTMSYDDEG